MNSGIKPNNLGERLRALRTSRGLSISEVARAVGIAESTYRDWEYGRQIKGEPYEGLADVLNTSLSFLITGKSHEAVLELEKIEVIAKGLKTKL